MFLKSQVKIRNNLIKCSPKLEPVTKRWRFSTSLVNQGMLQHMSLLGIYLEAHFCDAKGGRGHLESRTSLSELPRASTALREN